MNVDHLLSELTVAEKASLTSGSSFWYTAGDFVSTGCGDLDWAECFRMLTTIGYDGPISVEREDAGMDRLQGAAEAVTYLRGQLLDPPAMAFEAAFATRG
jgi:sugar phosphate isomerase/epimerase